MKPTRLLLAAAFFGSILTVSADLNIPSDGSDGALNITADTEIDLSQAVTGTWDQDNSANAGKGVYDPEKWAIVFKYTSVNIDGHTTGTPAVLDGRTLKFKNHPSHAPVVWLVQGNVAVNGVLDLRGKNGSGDGTVEGLVPSEPGPGGFRGGARGPTTADRGAGLGPAGGRTSSDFSGKYAVSYGNPQIIPLIGGSGGSGTFGSGGGGGGAILIACRNAVVINGLVAAEGASSGSAPQYSGAGGAVKLIAESVSGSGVIRAGGSPFTVDVPTTSSLSDLVLKP